MSGRTVENSLLATAAVIAVACASAVVGWVVYEMASYGDCVIAGVSAGLSLAASTATYALYEIGRRR